MDTLEEINRILIRCRTELDACAGKIKRSELPSKEHITNIGYALSYLFDIQAEIYRLKPELTPDYLKEPPVESEYNKIFGKLLLEVDSLCEQGNVEEAINSLVAFIETKPPGDFSQMASGKISEIRKQYGARRGGHA